MPLAATAFPSLARRDLRDSESVRVGLSVSLLLGCFGVGEAA